MHESSKFTVHNNTLLQQPNPSKHYLVKALAVNKLDTLCIIRKQKAIK